MPEDEPKSAYEIAMQKLRAQGDFEETTLSDEQKAEISEIRSRFKAKIAELEINQESKIRQAASFAEIDKLREDLASEKRRLNAQMEGEVQKVRGR